MNVKIIIDKFRSIHHFTYGSLAKKHNEKYDTNISASNLTNMIGRKDMYFSLLQRLLDIAGYSIIFVEKDITYDVLKNYPDKAHFFPPVPPKQKD